MKLTGRLIKLMDPLQTSVTPELHQELEQCFNQANEMESALEKQRGEILRLQTHNAAVEGDIRAVVATFAQVIGALGIDSETLGQERTDFGAMLPGILQKVVLKITTGGFDTHAFSKIGEIVPVLQKYRHLVEDIIEDKNTSKQ